MALVGGVANLIVACGASLAAGGLGGFVAPGLTTVARPRSEAAGEPAD